VTIDKSCHAMKKVTANTVNEITCTYSEITFGEVLIHFTCNMNLLGITNYDSNESILFLPRVSL
jgi:hypothetical protein